MCHSDEQSEEESHESRIYYLIFIIVGTSVPAFFSTNKV